MFTKGESGDTSDVMTLQISPHKLTTTKYSSLQSVNTFITKNSVMFCFPS